MTRKFYYILGLFVAVFLVAAPFRIGHAQSGWEECNPLSASFNLEQCRLHAEQFKKSRGPHGQPDESWYSWATSAPFPLSHDTACGVSPLSLDCRNGNSCRTPTTSLPKYIYGRPVSTWRGQTPVECHSERVSNAGKYVLTIDGFEGDEDDRYVDVFVNSDKVARIDNPTAGVPDNDAIEGGTARLVVNTHANSTIKVCSPDEDRTVPGAGTINGNSVVWLSIACQSATPTPSRIPTNRPSPTRQPTIPGSPTPPIHSDGIGFQFTPTEEVKNVGDTFEIQVTVDTKTEQVFGAEAHVQYDETILSLSSVREGDFFPAVLSTNNTGNSSIRGIVAEPADYRTGVGRIAFLTFTALKDGDTTVTFFCDPSAYNSSKIVKNDINATNVIDCAANNTLHVRVGNGGTQISPTDSQQQPTAEPTRPPANNRAKVLAAIILMIFILLIILLGI